MLRSAAAKKPRENRTRYVVLGMLTVQPMTGYGLRQAIAGSVGHFWQESFGQLYPTLRRLAAEGLVEARATRGGPGRPGATYHLTAKGRAALAAWLAVPPVLAPQRNEVLLKVFFAGAVAPEVTRRSLAKVAGELSAMRDALRGISAQMAAQPGAARHPDAPYWSLTLDFGLSFADMALAWADRADAVLRERQAARRTKWPSSR